MPGMQFLQNGGMTMPDSLGIFQSSGFSPPQMGGVDTFCKTMMMTQAKMQQEFITALLSILSSIDINHVPEPFVADNFRPYDYNRYGDDGDKISKLEPKMQEKTMQLMDYAKSMGLKVSINSGYRTPEEQDALCKKTHLAVKNSPHPQGKAVDLSIENGTDADYKKLGDFAKSIGMRWGGDFKSPAVERWHFDYDWR